MGDVPLSVAVSVRGRARGVLSALIVPSDSPSSLERGVRWVPPMLVALLIFLASSLPQGSVPSGLLVIPDKLAHMIEYFVLAAVLVPALESSWRVPHAGAAFAGALVVSALFGLSDEIHQMYVPGRDPSMYDLLADVCGAAAGGAITVWLASRLRGDA